MKNKGVIKKVKANFKTHPKIGQDVSITRYGTASFIAEKATQIIPLEKGKKLRENIDRILLHKILGPLTTGLFLLSIFGMLLFLGNLVQDILMGLTESLLSSFSTAEHSIIDMVLVQGLTGLAAGISIAGLSGCILWRGSRGREIRCIIDGRSPIC